MAYFNSFVYHLNWIEFVISPGRSYITELHEYPKGEGGAYIYIINTNKYCGLQCPFIENLRILDLIAYQHSASQYSANA